ncbi:hypothetical protein ZOSMA_45G00180 [Zostera marina]|uniref:Multipolar spindle 1 n=1 Tax=Zostera marina TaxID=29655 RepID=A0A0K9P0H1_ZOSMR|nr:hypothetical protein ZOSMA_45G00180 [Zostera marina]
MEVTSEAPIATTSDPKTLKLAVLIELLRSQKEQQNREQGKQQQQNSELAPSAATSDPKALKLAVAIALLRSQKEKQKKRKKEQEHEQPKSSDEAHHWKTKAKERKMELFRLRKEIEQLEDRGGEREKQYDLFSSRIVSCSCHFFDERGEIGAKRLRLGVVGDGDGDDRCEGWIDDVLRRRFLRHVRWNERRKKLAVSSVEHRRCVLEGDTEDEIEKLTTSADFLVELCGVISQNNNNNTLAALSHQAVDFVIASVKNLLSHAKDNELVEEIITDLIVRLAKRICNPSEQNGSSVLESDADSHIQQIIRMLGSNSYIGQRIMLSISQRICILAENLLLVDPFDDSFPDMNNWMFMMIQLIEFLISDNMQTWTVNEEFDNKLFEEWLRSVLHAHKSLELLECRNGLYILYMERVTGELAKWLRPLSRQGKLSLDILSSFLH